MDELTIEGKLYISSKRAAKVSGYAKDYIGQLCREGRVDSKLVGRSWYVYEPSIQEHRFNDERSKAHKKNVSSSPATHTEEKPIESVWERPEYTSEAVETLPMLDSEVKPEEVDPKEPETLSEMQSAWQEWFTEHKQEPNTRQEARQEVVESPIVEEKEPQEVPVRMIVSDIAPMREVEAPQADFRERIYKETYVPVQKVAPQTAARKKKPRKSPLILKSALVAFIVVIASVTLIATGFIEELHLSGLSDSPVFQYLQGSEVLEK